RRRNMISKRDWSSDVCSSDLTLVLRGSRRGERREVLREVGEEVVGRELGPVEDLVPVPIPVLVGDGGPEHVALRLEAPRVEGVQIGRASCRDRWNLSRCGEQS